MYKDSFALFDTIYIGGGTPSLLEPYQLAEIVETIFEYMKIDPSAEITIETNPCDIDMEKAHFLRSIGINRITLGIQSFNDKVLKFLGRRHTSDEATMAFDSLRKADFKNIGIDLIYAVPGQGLSDWLKTLKKAISLDPEHISCYELTFEKKTPFWKRVQRKELIPMDEDTKKAFFIETSRLLESKGYTHYEVSNFAKRNEYLSRHNQKYWLYVPYLGLGPSAHSLDGSRRWWNYSSIKKYCDLIEKKVLPVEGKELLSDEQIKIEKVFLGLRTCFGVEKAILSRCSEDTLALIQDSGFIKIVGDKIIPTRKGMSVADQLTAYLI